MDVMSAESPVPVTLRQVSFRPDPDVRVFLDGYVNAQGYEIKGFIQRLIRDEMQRVEQTGSASTPKANGRRDTAQRKRGSTSAESGIGSNQRELVPIEEMHVA